MTNYKRMTPVYHSEMFNLKGNNQRTWDTMISGCFCVSKSEVPFTSISADHDVARKIEHRGWRIEGDVQVCNCKCYNCGVRGLSQFT